MPVRCSKGDGFLEDRVSHMWADRAFRDHIDPEAKQVFQILLDRNQVQEAAARLKIDQKIKIAAGVVVAASK